MSDTREIRPGETLEWLILEPEHKSIWKYTCPYGRAVYDKVLHALAREALRYRAAGIVPAREVECKRCDGHGMEVYGDYIAESCRKCDGYGQVLEFVEAVRDEV